MATKTRRRIGSIDQGEPDRTPRRSAPALVWTRLRPPVRSGGAVPRRRLQAAADAAKRCRLTLVRAPAGYGKSSLLGQWFEASAAAGATVGWLSQGGAPDDLSTFFLYVVGALRQRRPDFGDALGVLLRAETQASAQAVAAAFIDEFRHIADEVVLFVDDFHLVEDPEVAAAIAAIVARPPPNFHLVLASRHALPFSTARLRSQGELLEIEADALRFDAGEGAEFLQAAGHDLSAADVDLLVSRTEGWPAGLQLAAISLAQRQDVDRVSAVLTGGHQHLSQYLADDVVDRLPARTIDFLLRTSLLSRFCPALCEAVTGEPGARAELDRLERQGLFIASLDGERQWYRYHHLFAAYLQRRLSDQLPGDVPLLHRRASDWFAAQGLVDEAFTHALAAGDTARAGEILDAEADHLFYSGRLTSFLRWAESLPEDELRRRPRALLHMAWSMILAWRFDDAARLIAVVEDMLAAGRAPPEPPNVTPLAHVVRHRKMMLHHFMDDVPAMERSLRALIEDFPETDHYLHGNLDTVMIYVGRETYRLQDIERHDVRARRDYEHTGSRFVFVWHEVILGPTYLQRGDTEPAERSLAAALRLAGEVSGERSPLAAMPALLYADLLYEIDELDRAAALVDAHGAEAEKLGFVDHLVAYYVTRARLAAQRDGAAGALSVLRAGRQAAVRFGFRRLARFVELEEVRLWAAAGDFAALKRFLAGIEQAELARACHPGSATTSADEALAFAWCRASVALGRPGDAIPVLRRWAGFAAARGALRTEVRALVALALARAQAGRDGEALRTLREAVQKAAPSRFIRSIVDEGQGVAAMLAQLFADDGATGGVAAFGRTLLARFDRMPAAMARDPAELCSAEPLSRREIDIVRLVGQGLSNKEIGARLGLTEGSVKWWLQEIYVKLGVRRRLLAVAAARDRGFI